MGRGEQSDLVELLDCGASRQRGDQYLDLPLSEFRERGDAASLALAVGVAKSAGERGRERLAGEIIEWRVNLYGVDTFSPRTAPGEREIFKRAFAEWIERADEERLKTSRSSDTILYKRISAAAITEERLAEAWALRSDGDLPLTLEWIEDDLTMTLLDESPLSAPAWELLTSDDLSDAEYEARRNWIQTSVASSSIERVISLVRDTLVAMGVDDGEQSSAATLLRKRIRNEVIAELTERAPKIITESGLDRESYRKKFSEIHARIEDESERLIAERISRLIIDHSDPLIPLTSPGLGSDNAQIETVDRIGREARAMIDDHGEEAIRRELIESSATERMALELVSEMVSGRDSADLYRRIFNAWERSAERALRELRDSPAEPRY